MLGVTCNNAANNNKMVQHMDKLINGFRGSTYRIRCFTHVLNLVAKSFTRVFEVKTKQEAIDPKAEPEEAELQALAVEIDIEELKEQIARYQAGSGVQDDDDESAWMDELGELSPEEVVELQAGLRPAKKVLTKVSHLSLSISHDDELLADTPPKQLRKLAFKIVNSSTILLPAWNRLLEVMHLDQKLIPRDVRTRWNSTYDMLSEAVKYKAAIKKLCAEEENGLRDLELSADEWETATQLRDALKVRLTII